VKGRWAAGIAPRNFAWVIRDHLAVSERPGGYARNHRRVRRQEEIIWLREQGFTLVVSLLGSPHNLHAYEEMDVPWAHFPFGPSAEPRLVLPDIFVHLQGWLAQGERLLLHQEELGDRVMGVIAGYLRWSGKVPSGPQSIAAVERIVRRQMGPLGRQLVALSPELDIGPGGRLDDSVGAGGGPEDAAGEADDAR
jgi:hypothetical protein